MKDKAIVVNDLIKKFGGILAVGGVSFTVKKGEIFGLIGPNGAGKTTVFNVITGVYSADAGTISIPHATSSEPVHLVGKPPSAIAAAGVARTFQNIRLFASMSVLENVLVAGEQSRRSGLWSEVTSTKKSRDDAKVIHNHASQLLEDMGLREHEHVEATSLSYGMQRRLEIARALMLKPRLLLLDEPAAGLNYGEAETLKQQIQNLRDRYKLTIILVEHNMQLVMKTCDRIHVLEHGVSIAEGTPHEIRSNARVIAAYLGEEPNA